MKATIRDLWTVIREMPAEMDARLRGWLEKNQPGALCVCGHARREHTTLGNCKADPMGCDGWRYAGRQG